MPSSNLHTIMKGCIMHIPCWSSIGAILNDGYGAFSQKSCCQGTGEHWTLRRVTKCTGVILHTKSVCQYEDILKASGSTKIWQRAWKLWTSKPEDRIFHSEIICTSLLSVAHQCPKCFCLLRSIIPQSLRSPPYFRTIWKKILLPYLQVYLSAYFLSWFCYEPRTFSQIMPSLDVTNSRSKGDT